MQGLRFSFVAACAVGVLSGSVFQAGEAPGADWPRWPFSRKTRSQSPDEDRAAARPSTRVQTPLIGEKTTVAGLNPIVLHGVGLVVGLDGTGDDPPPSTYREMILAEMRRRGVKQPNAYLASPDTALVVVRAYLPPLVREGERFDVEVRVPENSQTTSLNGGWLLETYLSEQALVPGQGLLKGHVYAKASGPILVSTGETDEESQAGVLRRGKILGGGESTRQRDLVINVRTDFATFKNAIQIADQIGKRFYHYSEHGLREPLAEAKTNQRIELLLQPRYKDNYPRYLQVIRHIPFRESEVARQVRMQKLKAELNTPATAERAALELEAIGFEAVPILKSGLKSASLEVRFHAGMALAYLGDPAGVPALAEAARQEPAFRIHAFAALAAIDEAEAHMALRELLGDTSAEVRYGAWRSLTTMDPDDPFVRGEKLNDEFHLHTIDTGGPPMVHLTRRMKAEIVLFGAEQRFTTPLTVRAGSHVLVNARAGSETVVVSRYAVGEQDHRRTVSTRIADVIRAAAELGATYPDVAQMLVQAEKQKNLPGRLELDALPAAGRVYQRPESDVSNASGTGGRRTRVGHRNQTPNLFGAPPEDVESERSEPPAREIESAATGAGKASLADVSQPPAGDEPPVDESQKSGFDPLKIFRRNGN
jgi:hypothetical protein